MQSQLVNEELEKKNIAVNLGGMTSSDEDVRNFRKQLAEKLRNGGPVYISSSGSSELHITVTDEANAEELLVLKVPKGILA